MAGAAGYLVCMTHAIVGEDGECPPDPPNLAGLHEGTPFS